MFDHAKYAADLDLIIKYGYEEYKRVAMEFQKVQLEFLKTYMWSISILAAAVFKLYADIKGHTGLVSYSGEPGPFVHGCFLFSLVLSAACFIVCVDAMRGRSRSALPFGDLMDLASLSHEAAGAPGSTVTRTSILASLNQNIALEVRNRHSVGIKLRGLSVALTASLLVPALGLAVLLW